MFSIGELAQQTGLRPSALRYYESVGLLSEPRRVSGRRRYDKGALQVLAVVKLAQQAGFTVAEIQTLLHGFAPETQPGIRWKVLARKKVEELDALIARAQQMKRVLRKGLDCDCLRFEDCVIEENKGCIQTSCHGAKDASNPSD